MRARMLPWQAILWVERFLPVPPAPPAEPSAAARRRAALAVQLILLTVLLPGVLRDRRNIRNFVERNDVTLAQLMLVLAVCVGIAAAAFGAKAWRDAGGGR